MDAQEVYDDEIGHEIEVRINGWKREKEGLSKAADRIKELDTLIAHAEAQGADILARRKARKEAAEAADKVAVAAAGKPKNG